MTRPKGKLRQTTAFLRGESGGLTVEAVMWLPFYLVFIALIADVSMMFHQYSKAQRMAQDLNRLAVLTWVEKDPTDPATVCAQNMQCRADALVRTLSPNATVTIYDKTDSVQVFIKMPSSDILPVGLLRAFGTFDINVTAAHIKDT